MCPHWSVVVWHSLPNLNAREKISQVAPATSTRIICNYSCSPIRLQNGLWNGNHHVVTSRLTTPFNETASMDRFSFAAREAARALGGFTLKVEQMKVVTSVLQGRDVFLPTGYGKTLCYAVLPGAFDCLQSGG